MKKIRYILVTFSDVRMRASEIPKLRGYFAQKFPENHLFHNHLPGNALSFKMPLIQYRIIQGSPALLGIGEGIDLMKKIFFEIEELKIGGDTVTCNEKQISLVEAGFGQSPDFHDYRFVSPWMALNSDNYKEYLALNPNERKQQLRKILRGNLLTISKGFSYTIPDFDSVSVEGWFKPVSRNLHGIPMNCFTGEFSVNFLIPDQLGLGKQSARGFGVVMNDNKEDR
jgi:hypothetical protein